MRLFLPLLLLLAPARALSPLEVLEGARSYVLLALPSLTDEALAQGLHKALTRRGVKVYILLDPKEADAPYAYTMGLYFAGAKIRLARVSRPEILADGRLYSGPKDARDFHLRFTNAWKEASPYTPNLNPPGVTVLPYDPFQQLRELLETALRNDTERVLTAREYARKLRDRLQSPPR